MRKILDIYLLLLVVFSATVFVSCSNESAVDDPKPGLTRLLDVTIDQAATTDEEKLYAERIYRVRFLVFNFVSYNPKLDVNRYYEVSAAESEKWVTGFNARLQVTEDPDKLVVAIVNEPTGTVTGTSKTWKELLDGVRYPSDLDRLTFALADAVNGQANPLTDASDLTPSGIPMIGMMWINIPETQWDGVDNDQDNAIRWPEPLTVERILARVDVYLKNTSTTQRGYIDASTRIELLNTSRTGYLMRHSYTSQYMGTRTVEIGKWMTTSDSRYDANTGIYYIPVSSIEIVNTDDGNGGQKGQYVCSFYIPEWKYDMSKTTGEQYKNDRFGIRFTGVKDLGGEDRGGTFYLIDAVHQTEGMKTLTGIERNNVYRLVGTIPEVPLTPIEFGTVTVSPWGGQQTVSFPVN